MAARPRVPQSAGAWPGRGSSHGRPPVKRPSPQQRTAGGTLLLVAAATAVYYYLPVPGRMREDSWAIMFFAGVTALAILIILAIGRLLRAGENVRIRGLILLLTLTVLFFSWADESVARLPGQFAELQTKTDALYFNISTLATVGFGDVHPVGQLARAAVTLQVVFNLVFLGAALSLITGFFRDRARRTRAGHPAGHPADHGEAGGPGSG
jgi:voltage-gated potassium channel